MFSWGLWACILKLKLSTVEQLSSHTCPCWPVISSHHDFQILTVKNFLASPSGSELQSCEHFLFFVIIVLGSPWARLRTAFVRLDSLAGDPPTDVKRYQSMNYGTDATVDCRLTVAFTLSDTVWNREREKKIEWEENFHWERRKLAFQLVFAIMDCRKHTNTKERMEIRGLVVSYCACSPNMQDIFEKMHINNGGKKHKNKVILCVVFSCFCEKKRKKRKCDSVF